MRGIYTLALSLLLALSIGCNQRESVPRIGIRLQDYNRNGEIETVYMCFDRNGDGRFDLTRVFEAGRTPVEKPYANECDIESLYIER